jgi:predicted MPP superfamily phosphohydrolase
VAPMLYVVAALAAAALLLAGYMLFVEPRLFRLRRVSLPAGRLPALRVLHLTDTHFHGRDEAILSFLGRLAASEQFDLLLLTGDLIDTPDGVASVECAARLFRPAIGAFAVLGGHDYLEVGAVRPYVHILTGIDLRQGCPENPAAEVVRRLKAAGVRVLDDSHCLVEAPGGRTFAVVGLCDAFEFEPDCEAAWAGLDPDVPVLVIAHSPDVLEEVSARGAQAAFFGHTHGGQVRLPLVGAVITHTHLPRRLAWGAFRQGPTSFVVCNGLGASLSTSFRLLCRPEAVLAELVAED